MLRTLFAIAALMSILLFGCVDQMDEGEVGSATVLSPESVDSMTVSTSVVSLEHLVGVHPASPIIIEDMDVFDFTSTEDGSRLVFATSVKNSRIDVWDMARLTKTISLPHPEPVICVAMSPREDTLITATTGKASPLRLWSLDSGELLREYPSPFAEVPKTNRAEQEDISGNWFDPADRWRISFSSLQPRNGFGFTCAAFGPAGNKIAAGCEDGRIIFWDATTAEPIKTLATGIPRILAIAFSADGSRLLAAARDDRIQLWDLDKDEMLRQFDETRRENWVEGYRPTIAFSADGSKFALYSPRALEILICDSTAGDILHRLQEPSCLPGGKLHLSLRRGLAFIDETILFSNTGGWIKLWNFTNGELIQQQECKSGVNAGYAYPSIQYVKFLPAVDAFVAIEVENDENTGHSYWTTVSYRPLALFNDVPHN